MSDFDQESLKEHRKQRGKLGIQPKFPLETQRDLSIAYTPGVAAACNAIHEDPEQAYALTIKGNSVAVLSDGSSVLGLGDIGPHAAMPVMEGKAILFKEFADIDAFPICVDTNSPEQVIAIARAIAPTFGGINLEDIGAPACFQIEDALQDLDIPVFHDDQHGTAIVARAAIENACRVTGKNIADLTIVINGAGAAGTAIATLLKRAAENDPQAAAVKDILMCDSKGIISPDRDNLNAEKQAVLEFTNDSKRSGDLKAALQGADVFIGVSRGNLLDENDIRTMNDAPIILAMANPIPEMMPDKAHAAGAAVVGTGRSDFPNQVNNVLVFPGIFRGALDVQATAITDHMKMAAVDALAAAVEDLSPECILPDPLNKAVAPMIAEAVARAAVEDGVARVE